MSILRPVKHTLAIFKSTVKSETVPEKFLSHVQQL